MKKMMDDGTVCREMTNPSYGQMVPADTRGRPKVKMADMPIITNAFRIETKCGHFNAFTYDPFTDHDTTYFGG